MKRIFSFFACILLVFSLCSCTESVNMGVLTEYQRGDFEAELQIKICGKESLCSLEKKSERLFLRLHGLDGFTFVLDESGAGIISGGTEIPLGGAPLSVRDVYLLFSTPVAGAWKIEKSSPGGVPVYVCSGDGITLYIDACSHLPLKIIYGSTEVNVLSFSVK